MQLPTPGLQQAGKSHGPSHRRDRTSGDRCQGVREAAVWAEKGSKDEQVEGSGCRLIHTLPKIPQGGGWGVAQHLPIMYCSGFLRQHRRIKKALRSAHPGRSQHLKRLPLHPSPSGLLGLLPHLPHQTCKKSNAQNSWGMEQGAGSAGPAHPQASFRTKAGSAYPLGPTLSATAARCCRLKVPCTPEGS